MIRIHSHAYMPSPLVISVIMVLPRKSPYRSSGRSASVLHPVTPQWAQGLEFEICNSTDHHDILAMRLNFCSYSCEYYMTSVFELKSHRGRNKQTGLYNFICCGLSQRCPRISYVGWYFLKRAYISGKDFGVQPSLVGRFCQGVSTNWRACITYSGEFASFGVFVHAGTGAWVYG